MKRDNNIIRLTNSETGEVFYFTKDYYVQICIGCTQSAMPLIKVGKSVRFPRSPRTALPLSVSMLFPVLSFYLFQSYSSFSQLTPFSQAPLTIFGAIMA